MPSPMTPNEQFVCLNLLDYLSDLFTCAKREEFTRESILIVLNGTRDDRELFDAEVVIHQQEATADI